MGKKIFSIIIGYAIFVITALLLFKFSGQKPHDNPPTFFVVFATAYGSVFSFIAGFVTYFFSKSSNLKINYALACIMASFAMFSFLKTSGNHWSQLLAIFIFAPISILGGLFIKQKNIKKSEPALINTMMHI
jgi:ABC-type Fe3+-siderophore transport system permease subunit